MGLLLVASAAVALPAGAPESSAASAASEDPAPDPLLHVVFHGPSEGRDAADPYERLVGAETGDYFTQAAAHGYGRLSGRIWLYPSACADCELVTPYATTRERGLLGVQYSYAAQEGKPISIRLSGAVDWELVFDHDVAGARFSTNDPYGPPVARAFGQFKHEARASVENDFEWERTMNVYAPVTVTYEVVPLEAPGATPPLPLSVRVVDLPVPDGYLRLTYRA